MNAWPFSVSAIVIFTLQEISNPSWYNGDRLYLSDLRVSVLTATLSSRYFVGRETSRGKCRTISLFVLRHVFIARILNKFPTSWWESKFLFNCGAQQFSKRKSHEEQQHIRNFWEQHCTYRIKNKSAKTVFWKKTVVEVSLPVKRIIYTRSKSFANNESVTAFSSQISEPPRQCKNSFFSLHKETKQNSDVCCFHMKYGLEIPLYMRYKLRKEDEKTRMGKNVTRNLYNFE